MIKSKDNVKKYKIKKYQYKQVINFMEINS